MIAKKLYINSIHKTSGTGSNFRVNIPTGGFTSSTGKIEFNKLTMWNFVKPFTSQNNKLSFSVDDGGNIENYILTIDHTKTYKASQLMEELENKFNSLKAGLVPEDGINYDFQTGYITFNFNLPVKFLSSGTTCQFKLNIDQLLDFPTFETVLISEILAYQVKQIYLDLSFGINSKNTNNSLLNSVCMIPLRGLFGDIIVLEPPTPLTWDIQTNKPIMQATVYLRDSNGSIINYEGELSLEFTYY